MVHGPLARPLHAIFLLEADPESRITPRGWSDPHAPAHDQHPCAAVISVITFRVPLSLYKPRHRQSPFPSTRTSSHRRVIAALPLGSSKLPSPPPLPVHRRDAATAASHPYRTLFLVTGPTEGTAAARRRSLSPFQEVPVRALHVPRSVRAVAALPSALGEFPVPRAFRFAASGRFPWSVDRSRVVA